MATRKLRRPEAAEPDAQSSSPGRVTFDSRGNPIWEWDTTAGDSTSILLKQLENDDLALEPTRSVRSMTGRIKKTRAPRAGRQTGEDESFELEPQTGKGGFDPYNRS